MSQLSLGRRGALHRSRESTSSGRIRVRPRGPRPCPPSSKRRPISSLPTSESLDLGESSRDRLRLITDMERVHRFSSSSTISFPSPTTPVSPVESPFTIPVPEITVVCPMSWQGYHQQEQLPIIEVEKPHPTTTPPPHSQPSVCPPRGLTRSWSIRSGQSDDSCYSQPSPLSPLEDTYDPRRASLMRLQLAQDILERKVCKMQMVEKERQETLDSAVSEDWLCDRHERFAAWERNEAAVLARQRADRSQ